MKISSLFEICFRVPINRIGFQGATRFIRKNGSYLYLHGHHHVHDRYMMAGTNYFMEVFILGDIISGMDIWGILWSGILEVFKIATPSLMDIGRGAVFGLVSVGILGWFFSFVCSSKREADDCAEIVHNLWDLFSLILNLKPKK